MACMVNGVTQIIMTKTDILDAIAELNVCGAYKINGQEVTEVPFQMNRMQIEPVYKSFAGWQTDISSLKDYSSLPAKMKEYINYINSYLQVPVKYISNGPGRDQIVTA